MTSDPGALQPNRAGSGNHLPTHRQSDSLADVLERVLDKGIVIVGDIQIRLLDIELLTIKLRLMVASVDKAREMGINWWETDSSLQSLGPGEDVEPSQLEQQNRELRERLERLERQLGVGNGDSPDEAEKSRAKSDG